MKTTLGAVFRPHHSIHLQNAIFIPEIVFYEITKFDLVITLCGDAKDKCPIIDKNKHMHWDIPDPANFKGNNTDTKQKYSEVRDLILKKIKTLS